MCRRSKIEARILTKVVKKFLGYVENGQPSECWIWQGPNSGNGRGGGYPRMSLDGQTVAVHKVMFVNSNGFVPGKKQIDHKCRK